MIEVKAANLRDASWITAHLRASDREEIFCQLPDRAGNIELALNLLNTGQGFIAYDKDTPLLLFGTSPINICCMSVWAMGVDGMERAVPAVSRFLVAEHIPLRLHQGFTSMEARSLVTHTEAHRWMESLGGAQHGPAYLYGKGGEHFVTYRWTVSSYRAISGSRWAVSVPKEQQ